MTRKGRVWIAVLLAVFLALCGLVLAAMIASRMGAAEGQGLAGGAIILGYGLLGAAGGVIAAVLLAIYLPPRALVVTVCLAGVAGLILLLRIAPAAMRSRAESRAHLEQAHENLLKFRVELTAINADRSLPFSRLLMDWDQRRYSVTIDGISCEHEMNGKQAVRMLSALREAEGVTYRNPDPCGESTGPPKYHLSFRIEEALPPATEAELDISESCLQRHPQLAGVAHAAAQIIREQGPEPDC